MKWLFYNYSHFGRSRAKCFRSGRQAINKLASRSQLINKFETASEIPKDSTHEAGRTTLKCTTPRRPQKCRVGGACVNHLFFKGGTQRGNYILKRKPASETIHWRTALFARIALGLIKHAAKAQVHMIKLFWTSSHVSPQLGGSQNGQWLMRKPISVFLMLVKTFHLIRLSLLKDNDTDRWKRAAI